MNLFLWLGPKYGLMHVAVAWTWYVSIGTTLTFIVGYFASLLLPSKSTTEKMAEQNG